MSTLSHEHFITPPPFVPHYPPFADFLITTSTDSETRRLMSSLGARLVEQGAHDVHLWGQQQPGLILNGFGVLDGRLQIGPARLATQPHKIPAGSCVLLVLTGPDVSVLRTDPFGTHAVYYGTRLVTNRLHLAALLQRTVNVNAAMATLHSNHMFCQQFGVCETPIQDVFLLRPGHRIVVTERVTVTAERAQTDDFQELEPKDYWELVRSGAEEIMENVQAILDSGYPVICDITGGQDSRINLGAIIALDRVKDVTFRTRYDPAAALMNATVSGTKALQKKQADLAIATGLIKEFGGSFREQHLDRTTTIETSIDGRLYLRRSQLFGAYHHIKPGYINPNLRVRPDLQVRIMGGSGELYRDYYQRWFGSEIDHHIYSEQLHSALKARFNPALPSGIFERLLGPYVSTFENLPGTTFSQKLDSHYLEFRNRFHFGQNLSSPSEAISISPLTSASLLRAARGLPASVKSSGRILFDVTRELCPRLPYYPYDSQKTFGLFESAYHRASDLDGSVLPLRSDPEIRKVRQSSGERSRRGKRGVTPDFTEICARGALACQDFLSSSGGPFSDLFDEGFANYLHQEVSKRPTRLASWYSRLQSFVDFQSSSQHSH